MIEVLAPTLQGPDEIALIAVRAKLRADAEQSRERRCLQKIAPMIIDAIFEPSIAFRVGAGLVLKHDRLAVRKNDAVPDEQDAGLTKRNLAIVAADQFGTLWHKEEASRRTVVDVLRDLRGDQARQVGLDAGDQSRRDDCARLQDIGRGRIHQTVGTDGTAIGGTVEKGELVVLHVLEGIQIDRRLLVR